MQVVSGQVGRYERGFGFLFQETRSKYRPVMVAYDRTVGHWVKDVQNIPYPMFAELWFGFFFSLCHYFVCFVLSGCSAEYSFFFSQFEEFHPFLAATSSGNASVKASAGKRNDGISAAELVCFGQKNIPTAREERKRNTDTLLRRNV